MLGPPSGNISKCFTTWAQPFPIPAQQDDQDPELSPPSSRRPSSLETVQHEMKVTNYNGPHQRVVLHESHHIIKNTIHKRMHNVF